MSKIISVEEIQSDMDALPVNYKTADVDALIKRYVKEGRDLSELRDHVLSEQQFHRIYFHGSLRQIKDVYDRARWIDNNLLFSDWWHTDQCIDFVKTLDVDTALEYARRYVTDADPFIRRWGYVMFISKLCRSREGLEPILALMHNDEQYYVQMGEAWLIAELSVFFPEEVLRWLGESDLKYNIAGKAIQKICDSYRIDDAVKQRFKDMRETRKLYR